VNVNAFDLAGSRVLISGAAAGIGAATAKVCAALGAAVVLADIQDAQVQADAIRAEGGSAEVLRCDISERAQAEAAIEAAMPLDALVVCAAIHPEDDWQDEGWDDAFDRVIAVNLLGPIHLSRAALPRMAQLGGGRIVLVGSLAGKSGGLIAGPHYVASKGGLHAFVKWLAQRGGRAGVLANGVAPASVRTPMMQGRPVDLSRIPLGRMAEPHEVAWPIAFLCSRAASYITGTVLDVNGGVYMA
jgi:NAD(P)-dependent dehydrogenase (short-subunit alcohol dehydrogenase family)